MVNFSRTGQPLSLKDIEEVEKGLGFSLPGDLRNFYLSHNGGRPNPRFFFKDEDWYGVHQFLAMKDDGKAGFEETYRILVLLTPEFPRGFIPIAVDEGGDYFLYCIEGGDYGKIFFNQSDYIDDPERFVVFLAENLISFIAALENAPD